MLFFLLLVRLLPLSLLGMWKDQKRIKRMFVLLVLLNMSGMPNAPCKDIKRKNITDVMRKHGTGNV